MTNKSLTMKWDDLLVDRMRVIMDSKGVEWEEKRMFGGQCFMVDDKMCFGTYKGGMMARVDPDENDAILELTEGSEMMVHGGRPMKGYIMVEAAAIEAEEQLEFWIEKCLEFNPKAKSSKKKKK